MKNKELAAEAEKPTSFIERIIILIRARKWDTILILVLLMVLAVTVPIASAAAISDAVRSSMKPLTESIQRVEESITTIEAFETNVLIERGIAGYKKVDTIEQLERSTQNAASIKLALMSPDVRDILFTLDPERTKMFEQYFFGDGL